jgi:Flp pilus assembly pilin Flp
VLAAVIGDARIAPREQYEIQQEKRLKMAGFDLNTTFRTIALATGFRGQRGQGLVEYGLILTLVSLVLVVSLLAVSGALAVVFDNITTSLNVA